MTVVPPRERPQELVQVPRNGREEECPAEDRRDRRNDDREDREDPQEAAAAAAASTPPRPAPCRARRRSRASRRRGRSSSGRPPRSRARRTPRGTPSAPSSSARYCRRIEREHREVADDGDEAEQHDPGCPPPDPSAPGGTAGGRRSDARHAQAVAGDRWTPSRPRALRVEDARPCEALMHAFTDSPIRRPRTQLPGAPVGIRLCRRTSPISTTRSRCRPPNSLSTRTARNANDPGRRRRIGRDQLDVLCARAQRERRRRELRAGTSPSTG